MHIGMLLVTSLANENDVSASLTTMHSWCAQNRGELEGRVRAAIHDQDVLGIISCVPVLSVCRKVLEVASPIDAEKIAALVGLCESFFASFGSGKQFTEALNASIKIVMSGQADRGEI